MQKNLIVSFSGGRTSAYMTKKILESQKYKEYKKHFVFANTGKENAETLEFVNKCSIEWGIDIVWLEAKINKEKGVGTTYTITDYKNASRNGEPFEQMIEVYGLPNKHYPHCTRELKQVPIKKWVKDNFGSYYEMAIGIRIDETKRINLATAKKNNWIYPLIFDFPTTKRDVLDFWKKQSFDLGLDDYLGNCDLCWKKSLKKRLMILNKKPQIGQWWREQEERDGEYVFDRDNLSIVQLLEMSKDEKYKKLTIDNDTDFLCACFGG